MIDDTAECDANVVPLGTLGPNGTPSPTGHLAQDLRSESTTPRFGFVTPNLCDDGHDGTSAGLNSAGGQAGGLTAADGFLRAWMPLIFDSPAYKHGNMLVVITFDESDVSGGAGAATACCNEHPGPNTPAPGNAGAATDSAAPGGGQIGALLLNSRYIVPGSTKTRVPTTTTRRYAATRTFSGRPPAGATERAISASPPPRGSFPSALTSSRRGSAAVRLRAPRAARNSSVQPAERGPVPRGVAHVLGGRQPDHGHVRPALQDLRRYP